MNKPRLIFFGNERLATGVTTDVLTLKALIAGDYDVAAVVSNQNAAKHSRKFRRLEIETAASEHNIPVLLTDKPLTLVQQLRNYQAVAAILVAYGRLVPQAVIDIFPAGIINLHPSLLPAHRGPTPVESVILSGELKTGVSIMQLTKDMDAGPVYGASAIKLSGRETKQALADQLLQVGSQLLIELLPDILSGQLVAASQDDSRASYDHLLTKTRSLIDWHKPARLLEREVRAFAGWPGSRTTLDGQDVIITAAQSVAEKNGQPASLSIGPAKELKVACGEGSLVIERLKPAGRREMTAREWLAGRGGRLTA